MSLRISSTALLTLAALSGCTAALEDRGPSPEFAASYPAQNSAPAAATGAIFQASSYQALATGQRASQIGDILTIRLVERTRASKSQSASGGRSSTTGVTLPGVLPSGVPNDFFEGGSDIDFTGDGAADQQNQLSGDITVTVADVLPNGVLAVRGEKRVRLNRGDEFIRFSGLVRPVDITLDNNVLSTRVADARISYAGTGQVAAPSRQGWLQRFFVAVSPF
ncbi:flagellar basal body L-ring protein FlgH [Pacificimonas sp. ICDLI1SI03]